MIWTIIDGREYQIDYYGPEAMYPVSRKMLDTLETTGTSPQMEVSILVGNNPATTGIRQTITVDAFDSQSKQGLNLFKYEVTPYSPCFDSYIGIRLLRDTYDGLDLQTPG